MKSLHIIPGSGGNFYCQNCLRDNVLVKTLREQGRGRFVPLYLPMFTDYKLAGSQTPIFFPAISLYLKYRFPFLKWLPSFIDSSFFLKKAAEKAGSTKADGLEGMTIEMLQGENGMMKDELHRLTEWAFKIEKPDVIHISNALLIGMAAPLKKALGIPVVCSLQDEKQWLDSVKEPFRTQIWSLMAQKALDVDMFISVSDYYTDEMKKRMRISDDKIQTIYVGIDLEGYSNIEVSEPTSGKAIAGKKHEGLAIGYLSKISESLGFGILLDAFIEIKKEEEFKNLKLLATGGLLDDSKKFIRKARKRLNSLGMEDDFEIIEEFGPENRIRFFNSIDILSVPVPGGEAFGTYMIEAMASGVPVVQPDEGAFKEIINKTGGGVVYSPNDSKHLADALKKLLRNSQKMAALGNKGKEAVFKDFSIEKMAEEIIGMYRNLKLET